LTGYAIRIKARNGSGFGVPSSPLTFLTPELLVPSKILKPKEKVWLITKVLDKKLRKKKNLNYYYEHQKMVLQQIYFMQNVIIKVQL